MPRALHTRQFRSVLVAVFCLLMAGSVSAQGFSNKLGMKTKVTLHRKLPAVIHFTGTKFKVVVAPQDPKYTDVALILKDRLEVEIAKSNPRLQMDDKSPELLIACRVTRFDQPPDVHTIQNQTVLAKSPNAQGKQQTKAVQVLVDYKTISGNLSISYNARDSKGRTLDATNITAEYSQAFETATNQAVNQSALDKMESPFKRMFGKKSDAPAGPPTPSQMQDKLINEAIEQIVPRITTTDESIEVLLARGKMDDANKLAEAGSWSKYLESVSEMPHFPKDDDDSYRLYDIGIASEASAYENEDEIAAKKLLDDAATYYGQASQKKKSTEKIYVEAEKRVETARIYMERLKKERKLFADNNGRPASTETANSASAAGGSVASEKSITAHSGSDSKESKPAAVTTNASNSKSPNNSVKAPSKLPPAKPVKAFTNDDVIKMTKGKVDEQTIIDSIRDAPVADFDLSPDANVTLTQQGVTPKVLAAMRDRAKKPNRRASTSGST